MNSVPSGANRHWIAEEISVDIEETLDEPMGTKDKFWTAGTDGQRWLFKYSRVAVDGYVSGEDWAEWLVSRIAVLLGLPAAEVRPAVCDGRRGLLSRSVLSTNEDLIHGNEILQAAIPDYDISLTTENPFYSVSAVKTALDSANLLVPWPSLEEMSAFEVWAGYLMMDAWVNGCDRHDQNWGIVQSGDRRWLAPSFDHGNALGFQERPQKHARLVADDELFERWLARGSCRYFAGKPRLTDLCREALDLVSQEARAYWMNSLSQVKPEAVFELVRAVPDHIMSEPSGSFVLKLLEKNKRRILNDQ
jgi:hypothetical protein